MTDSCYHHKKKRFYFVLLIIEIILLIGVSLSPAIRNIQEPDIYTSGLLHLKVLSFTEQVVPGKQAHLKLQGVPYHTYRLDVEYYSGYSEANGVGVRSANSKGIVEWHWRVGTNTYSGNFKLTIHDTRHSGYLYMRVVDKFKQDDTATIMLAISDCIIIVAIIFTLIAYREEKVQICNVIRRYGGTPGKEPSEKLTVLLCFLGATLSGGLIIAGVISLVCFICAILPDTLQLVFGYAVIGVIYLLCAAPLILTVILCIIHGKNKRR